MLENRHAIDIDFLNMDAFFYALNCEHTEELCNWQQINCINFRRCDVIMNAK